MPDLYMFIIVTIMGSGVGGAAPETRIVHLDIADRARCLEIKKSMDEEKPKLVDDVTGKPIILRTTNCVPFRADAMLDDLNYAIKKYSK